MKKTTSYLLILPTLLLYLAYFFIAYGISYFITQQLHLYNCSTIKIVLFIFIIFIINWLSKNCQNHNIYTISLLFLKLTDRDRPSPFKKRRKFTAKQWEEIRSNVKWKSPVDYPPKFDKDYFPMEKFNIEIPTVTAHDHIKNTRHTSSDATKYMFKDKRVWSYLNTEILEPDDEFIFLWNTWYDHYFWTIIDQFILTIPIFYMFYIIHWTIAETLLIKFKCQQHYLINRYFVGVGPIYAYYIYLYLFGEFPFYIKGLYEGFYMKNFRSWYTIPEWPLYCILYEWWFYLTIYSIIVIIFFYLAPNSIYLRNNKRLENANYLNYTFFFIPVTIGLLLPPIFAQKRLPFWDPVEEFILIDPLRTQFHYGVTYLICILIIIGVSSVIIFEFILIILQILRSKIHNDMSYYKDLEWLLFSGVSDDTDWDRTDCVPKILILDKTPEKKDEEIEEIKSNPRNQYEIMLSQEDVDLRKNNSLGFREYKIAIKEVVKGEEVEKIVLVEMWAGSYSKQIFLIWYFTIALYCLIIKLLFKYISWSALLYITWINFVVLLLVYFWFINKILGKEILSIKKCILYLKIFFIITICLIFLFYKDLFYIFS